jgi:hypothetical protein
MAEVTKGRFGFHRGVSEHEPPTAAYIQIYVKSSVLACGTKEGTRPPPQGFLQGCDWLSRKGRG